MGILSYLHRIHKLRTDGQSEMKVLHFNVAGASALLISWTPFLDWAAKSGALILEDVADLYHVSTETGKAVQHDDFNQRDGCRES